MKYRNTIIIIILGLLFVVFSFLQNKDPKIPQSQDIPSSQHEMIIIHSPIQNEGIGSPLAIIGSARGPWFFEGSFVIELNDSQGNHIARTFATAETDWMTEDFVPFTAELTFVKPEDTQGVLLFIKANASGLAEHDDALVFPIQFLDEEEIIESEQEIREITKTISLYYYNPDLDTDETGNILCSEKGLVQVLRDIPQTQTPIQDTINALLQGELTDEEIRHNITTEFPLAGFTLTGANLDSGHLQLSFDDPRNQTNGGSCRVTILLNQIIHTAQQFDEVHSISITPNTLFQA